MRQQQIMDTVSAAFGRLGRIVSFSFLDHPADIDRNDKQRLLVEFDSSRAANEAVRLYNGGDLACATGSKDSGPHGNSRGPRIRVDFARDQFF
uniref:RRM domain-containing protein n=1 Tax=Chromera velia CCMP2878 TaxID=1169474 RepID=A0A0G4HCN4_9ALVE|eukprot:Cvel_26264.t1-p1 / transcript=Cvel_26264.t1 / gene=Cvel_26264 / organism=Chromera_velia_CCMP2878 / gene_product=hypothetical protein / transcript_product=hypothetical protein / location=Cvel_scaffold3099:529-1176(+) / protein_length=92 / sequence_SO=supercontig / SO=protein_coding / is_pseudo=false